MLVTQLFIDDFTARITAADGGARLGAKTGVFQKESSIRPLLLALNGRLNTNVSWGDVSAQFAPLIQAMGADKQRKYADALKFLEKGLSGAGSHMFAALRPLSEKLSKAQQRYTIPIVQGDAGHGLCLHMSYLWLKERLKFHVTSSFPRIADRNVIASKHAREVTVKAMASLAAGDATIVEGGRRHGLTLDPLNWTRSFHDIHTSLERNTEIQGLLINFWSGQHAIAIVRERDGNYQFYDSNAGSYRVAPGSLQAFLAAYNNTCLPLKWPGYNLAATAHFSSIYKAS